MIRCDKLIWKHLAFVVPASVCFTTAEPLAVPLPSSPAPHGKTVLWSPIFSATWDALKVETGKVLGVDPPNATINALEAFRWNRDATFPAGSWKTWCGPATEAFLKTVNADAMTMTGDTNAPFRLQDFNSSHKAAFGLLDHKIEFSRELHRSKAVPLKFKTETTESPVAFFGDRGHHPALKALLWNPADKSQAVQIRCKNEEDSLILYLPPASMDLQSACERIAELLKEDANPQGGASFESLDEIRIPYLTIEIETDVASALTGNIHFEKLGPGSSIAEARQLVRFHLHEKGAKVRAETTIAASPFGPVEPRTPPPPRHFIYDRPFFAFMWRKGSDWPYLATWVATADGMEPFKAAAK